MCLENYVKHTRNQQKHIRKHKKKIVQTSTIRTLPRAASICKGGIPTGCHEDLSPGLQCNSIPGCSIILKTRLFGPVKVGRCWGFKETTRRTEHEFLKCSATWKKHHEMWIKINPSILVMTSQNQQKTQGESPPFAILAIIYSYQVSYGKALEVAAVGASNGKPRLFK